MIKTPLTNLYKHWKYHKNFDCDKCNHYRNFNQEFKINEFLTNWKQTKRYQKRYIFINNQKK